MGEMGDRMELSDFVGARRIPLIGRRTYLQEIRQRIHQRGVHVLYFEGEGGIGKTALLEAALEHSLQEQGRADANRGCVASEIIDLYHVDSHTPEGLIRQITQVTRPGSFAETRRTLGSLSRARSLGNVELANEKVQALHRQFVQEFLAMMTDGVVLAFDTLEVLQYEYDPFQEELGQDLPLLSAGEWLFQTFFPSLRGNAVILLAGRPGQVKERLANLRQDNPRLEFWHTQLGALQAEESKQYLETLARAEWEHGDPDAAERLREFVEEQGPVVHFLTGGRPILLALVADMLAFGWTLPPSLSQTLEDLSQLEAESLRQEIERALVVRIQESPSLLGETIRALAWLRKGATPELLARIMDLETPDGEWDVGATQEYLEQAVRLTLVKVRPHEQRVFLHDEMYALLDRHILQMCSQEERDRVYVAVLRYYQDRVRDLHRQIGRTPGINPTLQAARRQAYVETVHYRLCHQPALGFTTYVWRAEEALNGLDAELDMLLRTELLRTIGLLRERDRLGDLNPREVEMDVAVRWGMRALLFQNDSEGALEIFDTIARRWGQEAEAFGLVWVHLQLYRAAAMMMRAEEGDWPRARTLLEEVELRTGEQLVGAQDPANRRGFLDWVRPSRESPETSGVEGQRWRAKILKALALNCQGYLDQQQGRYAQAVEHYQTSAMLQRRLRMAGLASVLVNLAYVMTLTGEFRHARLLSEEAESWARHRGQDHTLALALNVRALIETYDGHHADALGYAEQALEIVRGLRAPRVQGLIQVTQARTQRYLLTSSVDDSRQVNPQMVEESLKGINHAVNLLKNNPPDRVAALIERGCLHREIARWHYLRNRELEAVRSARSSRRDLQRTIVLAGAMDLPDQAAAAWTNLGWLWYYARQMGMATKALEEVYALIPAGYQFSPSGPLPSMAREPSKSEARLPFWSALGKAEMLQAYMALDRALEARDEEVHEAALSEAVSHITLSLAYDEQIAEEHFDVTRAEDGLHKRIRQDGLSIWRLHRHAQKAAEARRLTQPTRFQAFLNQMFGPAELWA